MRTSWKTLHGNARRCHRTRFRIRRTGGRRPALRRWGARLGARCCPCRATSRCRAWGNATSYFASTVPSFVVSRAGLATRALSREGAASSSRAEAVPARARMHRASVFMWELVCNEGATPKPSKPGRVGTRADGVREPPRGERRPRGAANRSIHTLEGSIHTLEGSIHTLEGSIHTLEGSIHTLEGSIHTLEGSIHTLEGSIHTLEARSIRMTGQAIRLAAAKARAGKITGSGGGNGNIRPDQSGRRALVRAA